MATMLSDEDKRSSENEEQRVDGGSDDETEELVYMEMEGARNLEGKLSNNVCIHGMTHATNMT